MSDMLQLLEPLIPALRRYARALLRDRTAADDLVQDCLERAVGAWHQRRDGGDARTWVFAILHNLAINRLRQTARRGRQVPLEAMDEASRARPPAQEQGLRYRELLSSFAELREEQQSVLLLVTVENLSYAEAARVLNVPVGTVMSRLCRARERLLHSSEGLEDSVPRGGEVQSQSGREHLRRVK